MMDIYSFIINIVKSLQKQIDIFILNIYQAILDLGYLQKQNYQYTRFQANIQEQFKNMMRQILIMHGHISQSQIKLI